MADDAVKSPSPSGEGLGVGKRQNILAERAREMRNNPTEPEIRLWQYLRKSQLGGHKFRRQARIDRYVADFLCPAKALIVEIDGDTHDPVKDARREARLADLGYRTMRFSNNDVMLNIEGVWESIRTELAAQLDRWPHPNPSPEGEGLSIRQALTGAASRFGFSQTPRLDAELLMAHALGVSREAMLLSRLCDRVPPAFTELVQRRTQHEPIAYITGTRAFWTIDLAVDRRVLVPRADSETLIEAALDHFAGTPGPRSILDLGTGSGALLLAALDQWPEATGLGLDLSHDAIAAARVNVRALGMVGRARITRGTWSGQDRPGGWDLILCNPPYIAEGADLPREVAGWEPASALYSGAEGHDDLLMLAGVLGRQIAPGGVACVEIGADQGTWGLALFEAQGLKVTLRQDLGGRDRCLVITP